MCDLEDETAVRTRLHSVVKIPLGEVDDTRFEKLTDWFADKCQSGKKAKEQVVEAGLFQILQVGLLHEDSRVVAAVLKMMGYFGSDPMGFQALALQGDLLLNAVSMCFGTAVGWAVRIRVAALFTLRCFASHNKGREWLSSHPLRDVVISGFSDPSIYVKDGAAQLLQHMLLGSAGMGEGVGELSNYASARGLLGLEEAEVEKVLGVLQFGCLLTSCQGDHSVFANTVQGPSGSCSSCQGLARDLGLIEQACSFMRNHVGLGLPREVQDLLVENLAIACRAGAFARYDKRTRHFDSLAELDEGLTKKVGDLTLLLMQKDSELGFRMSIVVGILIKLCVSNERPEKLSAMSPLLAHLWLVPSKVFELVQTQQLSGSLCRATRQFLIPEMLTFLEEKGYLTMLLKNVKQVFSDEYDPNIASLSLDILQDAGCLLLQESDTNVALSHSDISEPPTKRLRSSGSLHCNPGPLSQHHCPPVSLLIHLIGTANGVCNTEDVAAGGPTDNCLWRVREIAKLWNILTGWLSQFTDFLEPTPVIPFKALLPLLERSCTSEQWQVRDEVQKCCGLLLRTCEPDMLMDIVTRGLNDEDSYVRVSALKATQAAFASSSKHLLDNVKGFSAPMLVKQILGLICDSEAAVREQALFAVASFVTTQDTYANVLCSFNSEIRIAVSSFNGEVEWEVQCAWLDLIKIFLCSFLRSPSVQLHALCELLTAVNLLQLGVESMARAVRQKAWEEIGHLHGLLEKLHPKITKANETPSMLSHLATFLRGVAQDIPVKIRSNAREQTYIDEEFPADCLEATLDCY